LGPRGAAHLPPPSLPLLVVGRLGAPRPSRRFSPAACFPLPLRVLGQSRGGTAASAWARRARPAGAGGYFGSRRRCMWGPPISPEVVTCSSPSPPTTRIPLSFFPRAVLLPAAAWSHPYPSKLPPSRPSARPRSAVSPAPLSSLAPLSSWLPSRLSARGLELGPAPVARGRRSASAQSPQRAAQPYPSLLSRRGRG
jgi:hypothetical protein